MFGQSRFAGWPGVVPESQFVEALRGNVFRADRHDVSGEDPADAPEERERFRAVAEFDVGKQGLGVQFAAPGLMVTMLWFLACMNVWNLIDGMDGLASGVGLLVSGTLTGPAPNRATRAGNPTVRRRRFH